MLEPFWWSVVVFDSIFVVLLFFIRFGPKLAIWGLGFFGVGYFAVLELQSTNFRVASFWGLGFRDHWDVAFDVLGSLTVVFEVSI